MPNKQGPLIAAIFFANTVLVSVSGAQENMPAVPHSAPRTVMGPPEKPFPNGIVLPPKDYRGQPPLTANPYKPCGLDDVDISAAYKTGGRGEWTLSVIPEEREEGFQPYFKLSKKTGPKPKTDDPCSKGQGVLGDMKP